MKIRCRVVHNEDLVEIISISTEVWQEVHVLTKILLDLKVFQLTLKFIGD